MRIIASPVSTDFSQFASLRAESIDTILRLRLTFSSSTLYYQFAYLVE